MSAAAVVAISLALSATASAQGGLYGDDQRMTQATSGGFQQQVAGYQAPPVAPVVFSQPDPPVTFTQPSFSIDDCSESLRTVAPLQAMRFRPRRVADVPVDDCDGSDGSASSTRRTEFPPAPVIVDQPRSEPAPSTQVVVGDGSVEGTGSSYTNRNTGRGASGRRRGTNGGTMLHSAGALLIALALALAVFA
ncbi:Uncharacterized protein PBTT_09308 [Plasmodiophora brassicae]|uniref:Uncharacterized protein n=1 Tax=Plasmodiophora brassicae TaxID=37360 RepID=A0A3P3YLQ2_PLABS|nr:unnamed protein product [Plasmodiophora brassicae]